MTETTVKVEDKSMERLAGILCENGIYRVHAYEVGENRFHYFPTIWFKGDESEGMKAAMIALEHGYTLLELKHCHRYSRG